MAKHCKKKKADVIGMVWDVPLGAGMFAKQYEATRVPSLLAGFVPPRASYREILCLMLPRIVPVGILLPMPLVLAGYWNKVLVYACMYGLLALSCDFLASSRREIRAEEQRKRASS